MSMNEEMMANAMKDAATVVAAAYANDGDRRCSS
jgi:hypothetical protein